MNKLLSITMTLTALAAAACTPQHRATDLPPGQYHHTTRSVDSAGTSEVDSETTTVGEDAYGNKTAVVSKKKTVDPRGLFNKRSSTTTTVIKDEN